MKILFVAPRYHTNQIEVVKTLKEAGHEIHFLCLYSGGASEDHTVLSPRVVPHSNIYKAAACLFGWDATVSKREVMFYGFASIRWYAQYLKAEQPDLIITRDLGNFSKLTILYARLFRIPWILYNQNPLYRTQRSLYKKILLQTLRCLWWQKIVRVTPVLGTRANGVKSPHAYYLPLIVPAQQTQTKSISKPVQILSIGKFQDRKNHLLLLDAIQRLSKKYTFQLHIVGTAELKKFQSYKQTIISYIQKNNLSDIVTISTGIPYTNIGHVYAMSDIFVIPSKHELFSISVLEAMSHSLPVVCSDTNGAQYCVENDITGYIFKSDNAEDLEEKISILLNNPEQSRQMGRVGHERVLQKYNARTYYDTFKKIITQEYPSLVEKM